MEALALPTEASVRTALRTQQVVAYESGVTDTVDPLAGSYYVEAKTTAIEKDAMEYIKKIDELGGSAKAIDNGYIQNEIMDAAYNYQKDIETNERIVVGMNKFQIEEAPPTGLLRVDPIVGELQTNKLIALRAKRNNEAVATKLETLKAACSTDENLMPIILDAVKEYATLGEICGVMREVFGEYQQSVII
ncbi:MAG: methylmalonyl-CoA mutase family protein [Acidaminobacteraceae bacterium]